MTGAGTHNRVGALSREVAVAQNALEPGALSTFSSPYLPILKIFSRLATDVELWPGTDIAMCSIYAGAVVTVLALLALVGRPKARWRWWLLGIGLLSLSFALGSTLPLRGWLYDWFFPTRFFRHSAIFRVYFIFAISVLAILATGDLALAIRQATDSIWRLFLCAASIVAISALSVFLFFSRHPANARVPEELVSMGFIHAFLVWSGICVVAIAAVIASTRSRRWLLPGLLLALSASDAFLTTALSVRIMADQSAFGINRWKALDERHSSSLSLTSRGLLREEVLAYEDGGNRFDVTNDQMITKVPVARSYTTAVNDFYLVMMKHSILKQMPIGSERIWFSTEVVTVAPTVRNFRAFYNWVEARRDFPLVIHSREELLSPPEKDSANEAVTEQISQIERLPVAERIPVKVLNYLPEELTFEAIVATDGWLLVTDRWARGWRAEINGKTVEVYGGNFVFRALPVSAGPNTVRFTYEPTGFPWLLILSWGTLSLVAFRSGYHCCRTRR